MMKTHKFKKQKFSTHIKINFFAKHTYEKNGEEVIADTNSTL